MMINIFKNKNFPKKNNKTEIIVLTYLSYRAADGSPYPKIIS